ncbi:hypothetical protein ASD99_21515 [Mesorhizobium sp. Root695]|uniref:hypothetical protein n=1 Tax=Mesorhizobium sp. Root695 TaxID=1736589 RepID=UPI00070CD834|nr:hypothetical protein [Mesorhizobium sp. Root695]KRB30995.1 hypothetical protein ASD99_21515 [Mesorhizobium sp. Root695]
MPFDLLCHDLRDRPLEDRRQVLAELIPATQCIQFRQALPRESTAIFHPIDKSLEGMVWERKDGKYRNGNRIALSEDHGFRCRRIELLGIEREAGKPAFTLMYEGGTGRYVGKDD